MGLLRLFLALTVACDHFYVNIVIRLVGGTRGIDQYIVINAGFAVVLFYCISGFLISLVLARKYPIGWAGTAAFYGSRFTRIFSVYWPMLALCALWFEPPHGALDDLVSLVIVGGDWVAAFRDYPAEHVPYFGPLGPMWSVAAELTFYAMAPWLLRSLRLSLVCFAASLSLRLWLQARYGLHQAWIYHFFLTSLCFFLAGHLARVASERWPQLLAAIGPAALQFTAWSIYMTMGTGSFVSPWFYAMVGGFALSLPWLFERTSRYRTMNHLGDLSYPLYVCHGSLIGLIGAPTALAPFLAGSLLGIPRDLVAVIVFAAIATAVAAAAHALIEKPCRKEMQRALHGLAQLSRLRDLVATRPVAPQPAQIGARPNAS